MWYGVVWYGVVWLCKAVMVGQCAVRLYLVMYGFVKQVRLGLFVAVLLGYVG